MKESALKSIKIAAANIFEVFIWANFTFFGHFVLGCAFFPVVISVAARGALVEVLLARTAAVTHIASFLVNLAKTF